MEWSDGCSSTTECLEAEARWQVDRICADADVIDADGAVDKVEFDKWYKSGSDVAHEWQRLFFLFGVNPSELPKPKMSAH